MEIHATIIHRDISCYGSHPKFAHEHPHISAIPDNIRDKIPSIQIQGNSERANSFLIVSQTNECMFLGQVDICDLSTENALLLAWETGDVPSDGNGRSYRMDCAIAMIDSRLAKWLTDRWHGLYQKHLLYERFVELERKNGVDFDTIQRETKEALLVRELDDESIRRKRERIREELGLDDEAVEKQRKLIRRQLRASLKA